MFIGAIQGLQLGVKIRKITFAVISGSTNTYREID